MASELLTRILEEEVVLEFVHPVYSQDGIPGVGFFDTNHQSLFVIPTKDETEARKLHTQFVCLFLAAYYRIQDRKGAL